MRGFCPQDMRTVLHRLTIRLSGKASPAGRRLKKRLLQPGKRFDGWFEEAVEAAAQEASCARD